MPFLGRKGVDGDAVLEGVDAGIVDQDVEPAERLQRLVDCRDHGRLIADVDGDGDGVGQLCGDATRSLAIDVGNDDGGAVFCQPVHRRPADRAGPSGDEGNPSFQVNVHTGLPSSWAAGRSCQKSRA